MTMIRMVDSFRVAALVAALFVLLEPAHAQQRVVPQDRTQIQLSFAPLVKNTAPAVVNIYTKRTVRAATSPLFNDPFFRRFFGEQLPGARERVQNALGSGVIVDPSGLIVTNNHVIKGADQITAILSDRREFEASVVRADERSDLAVLRINPGSERLPVLELMDSDDLEVGDLVLAIGNPFGVGQTVTSGIVSAVARTRVGIADYGFFIQTDAAINPGNSGGALISMSGKLAGINTAIFSRDGGSMGIGFAIPSNMVQTVVAAAAGNGRIVRPWFGANTQTVTAELAPTLGLPRPVGVIVGEVFSGGPAERAGLRRGDVVIQVEGREIADSDSLRFRIATHPVGGRVRLTVFRDGSERAVTVDLVAPPETPARDALVLRGNQPLAGATVANLSPALVDELGLDIVPRGVIVTEIRRSSSAELIRLAPGDVLLRINDHEIKAVEDVRRATADAVRPWRLQFRRSERVINLAVGG
jgi:Do/DeqQ family serine protease